MFLIMWQRLTTGFVGGYGVAGDIGAASELLQQVYPHHFADHLNGNVLRLYDLRLKRLPMCSQPKLATALRLQKSGANC